MLKNLMQNFVDFHSYHLSCGTCRVQKSCSMPIQIKSRLQGIKIWRDNLTCRLKYRISCTETRCLIWEKEMANGILSQRISKSRIIIIIIIVIIISSPSDVTLTNPINSCKLYIQIRSRQQILLKSQHCASGATCSKHCCTLDAGWMDAVTVIYHYCCCTTAVTVITRIS
jgi:hypothetical protein